MRLAVAFLACFALSSSAPLPVVDSSDVTAFLTSLALSDENRAKSGQVVVSYQNQASGKTFDHDNAPNPLFTSVDANLLSEHTYKSFTDLLAKFTSQDANVADPETADRKEAALNFIDDISLTNVFMQAWSYLSTAGVASSDYDEFCDQLYTVWFSVFARDKVAGSSGFKATFFGEYQGDVVVGLTNWIRFYQLESANKGVNYHGWFAKQPDVQLQMQFGLELPVGEKQAFRSNILLNTSPEFEFIAYAVCALTGNSACNLMIAGNEVGLHIDTVTVDGNRVISVAYSSIGDVSATTTKKPTTKGPTVDPELQELVDAMRAQDEDKPSSSQYTLNWGDKLGSKPKPSGKDLMADVDESLFLTPVYAALKKVYDNGILNPDVCVSETDYNSGFKRSILQGILDTWSTTKPFQLMHDFLVGRGKVPADLTQFKQFLTTFWFGTYTRCSDKKTIGSSGFEHVFSGEWKGSTIDGHHNWMKYYLNQKSGDIKYYGYYSYQGQLTGTYEYDWAGLNKKTGGMLFGTSPVFDFSLFTACSLTHTGEAGCRFSIDDVPLAVTSYTQDCAGGGLCLSTSYPEDGF